MRRTNGSGWTRGIGALVCALAALALAATQAAAVPANFDSTGIGFIPTPALNALPSADIGLATPLLSAGDPSGGGSFDVEFSGSSEGEVCILASASPNTCQANLNNVTTAYSALVTLEISAITSSQISGPFTLALTMLNLMSPNGDVYAPGEVSIALNPTAPAMLNTSAVPGFDFDGSFTPFVRIEDTACTNSGGDCNYLAWTIVGLGDKVTFRFDMSLPPAGRDTPQLLFNAIPVVVPEPGTGLLMALGLAGLSLGGRRAGRERR